MVKRAEGSREKPAKPEVDCVRRERLAEILDISPRTVSRKVARGELPPPVKIGKGTARWRLRDIEAYLAKSQAR